MAVVSELEIINAKGMHARASAKFVKLAGTFSSDVRISRDGHEVDGKSILGLLTLAATQGSVVRLTVDGDDEQRASEALTSLIENRFDEGE